MTPVKLSEKQIHAGWRVVQFGEIARNISERVDPSRTDLEVYVGLEHLDPQSLRITRRGVPADVKGQKLRVRPGQIIFGKRRAYQKKLAVADFEGICSAHAMVLEAVPGKIIPELLPFFMQSDMFMDRAVAISEGSLSPTIKWKILAIQEFPLPPLERQKEILEALVKVEEVLFCNQECLNILTEKTFVSLMSHLFEHGTNDTNLKNSKTAQTPVSWDSSKLSEINEAAKKSLTPTDFPNESFEHYSIPAFQNNKQKPLIESGQNIQSNKIVLSNHTVLFGKLNPRKIKVWLIKSKTHHKKIASTEFLPFYSSILLPEFIYYY